MSEIQLTEIPRWRINRGGIVNIWQYDEQEFDFSGGRVIFQGTNGSGKSRTLELLLPLCLDGDLRQLGSKGFDTVSIRRLMLDEYSGGPNRIGYAWIELCRGDEYLTCGIGVKASATSQQVSDSWRFITPDRIGVDVSLVGADRAPLTQPQLKEVIGADRVLDDVAFRAAIAERVYALPVARYGDLLHLQRTLRNPDVGLKVLEGQLEQILADALPPLDPTMIESLASSFEDLESIRENIARLSRADSALRSFLGGYTGYAAAAVRGAAEQAQSAAKALASTESEVRRLTERLAGQREEHEASARALDELEGRGDELANRIDAVKEHPAYQGLQDLADRKRLVAHAHAAAAAALQSAAAARTNEDRGVEAVLTVLRRLRADLADAADAAATTRHRLAAAGLDAALCPQVAVPADAEPATDTQSVRAKPDPAESPLRIERRTPPSVRPAELEASLAAAAEQAGLAARAAAERAALTLSLHERALGLDREQSSVDHRRQSARQAQLAATSAAGHRHQAAQRLDDAVLTLLNAIRDWAAAGPFADGGHRPPEADHALLRDDPDAGRALAREVRTWAAPQLTALRARVTAATGLVAEVDEASRQTGGELAALRKGADPRPPAPAFATAERDPAQGAAFYRLVDFADSLAESARAGLEAALRACGLLNAWVTADGTVRGAELVAIAGTPRSPSLADVLVAAVPPDCPVAAATVDALLASVGLDDTIGDGLTVGRDGSWRAGVLTGSTSDADREHAEFVGAGARQATRQRRIAELTARQGELAARRDTATAELTATQRDLAAWERHLDAYPDDRAVVAAHAGTAAAARLATEAATAASTARAEVDALAARFGASRTELARDASDAGLIADTEALARARAAGSEARTSADALRAALSGRCATTVRDLADALHDHGAAVEDRVGAETAADQQCRDYATEAAALEALSTTIGGAAEEIDAQLATLDAERRAVRAELPSARERTTALAGAVIRTETQLENKDGDIAGRRAAAESARVEFRDACAAPGVWLAATTDSADGPPVPGDPAEALDLLAAVARRAASTETVITRLQALQTSLAGSHDITLDRHAGIMTVVVSGPQGASPVAEAALAVGAALAEQRGYLNEQYQEIFASYMLRNLAERLAVQIEVAEDLCARMNAVLDVARSSQGVHVQLEWHPAAALDDTTLQALKLVRLPFAKRSAEQDDELRTAFTELIDAERDTQSGGYAEILARALDYRAWHTFTVRVRDTGPDGKPRMRRMRQLSSGETRLISYVTLFAAAAAFYGALSEDSPVAPLRLVLLDEAFERLDDPTIARMLGLLVDLDMDWIITWPSGWGVSGKIPRMHIYEVLRPKSGRGVACTHTVWTGSGLDRDQD